MNPSTTISPVQATKVASCFSIIDYFSKILEGDPYTIERKCTQPQRFRGHTIFKNAEFP